MEGTFDQSKPAPMCEVCGKNEAVSFSAFFHGLPVRECKWKYTCNCTSEAEGYYISLNVYFDNPAFAIELLKQKNWMTDEAWDEFCAMMSRYKGDYDTEKA